MKEIEAERENEVTRVVKVRDEGKVEAENENLI